MHVLRLGTIIEWKKHENKYDTLIFQITMHGNTLVSVYKHIDRSLLPDEYLSEDYDGPRIGTCQQIIGKI